jgi:sugar (pentulose or hexulose) kinase
MAAVRHWLPYPQYWAWRLSGVAANEVTSLGCHTLLWRPREERFTALAEHAGWAARFAPMRRAWETLGLLEPALASRLGLPRGVQVLCGAHDSNACLARYLRSWPRMTLVSTGTWVVVMASGTPLRALDDAWDMAANVSVRGDAVPTGRFMGGREFERLCGGVDPALADRAVLRELVAAGVRVLPGAEAVTFADGRSVSAGDLARSLSPRERATLAALHTAETTAAIVQQLGALGPLTVDGPFAGNVVYLDVLAALLGQGVHASTDSVEGTARGGWVLAHWTEARPTPPLVREVAVPAEAHELRTYRLPRHGATGPHQALGIGT